MQTQPSHGEHGLTRLDNYLALRTRAYLYDYLPLELPGMVSFYHASLGINSGK